LTARLRRRAAEAIGDHTRSVSDVAAEHGMSWPIAHRAFIAYAESVAPVDGPPPAVTVLGIHETRRGKGRYEVQTDTGVRVSIIVGHRLRKGAVNSARGAGKFLADAIAATRRTGAVGAVCCRLDSAFYNHSVVGVILAGSARFWHHRPHGQSRDEGHRRHPGGPVGVGQRSPRRSSTRTSSDGSPTLRSPRSPTPRSLPNPRRTG